MPLQRLSLGKMVAQLQCSLRVRAARYKEWGLASWHVPHIGPRSRMCADWVGCTLEPLDIVFFPSLQKDAMFLVLS